MIAAHANLEHLALHGDWPHLPVAGDKGVLRALREVRRRFSQDVALVLA